MASPQTSIASPRPSFREENAEGLAFFHDYAPPTGDFLQDVVDGLSSKPKAISPKYFYDEVGSQLFDEICETDEYYPTRTEIALLDQISGEIADLAGTESTVVEFGSGSSVKIRLLLDALENPAHYVALDISKDHLKKSAQKIARDYPDVSVGAICADFTAEMPIPSTEGLRSPNGRRIGFLPGSTIGNFHPEDAENFLENAHELLEPGGAFLIGVDLKKDQQILDAAYNDKAGVTAKFNLNLLDRMERELEAEVDQDQFVHKAFYNSDLGRIEMHLEATSPQEIALADQSFAFSKGETIHTENSYKYKVDEFCRLAEKAGFRREQSWTDHASLFSVHFLESVG